MNELREEVAMLRDSQVAAKIHFSTFFCFTAKAFTRASTREQSDVIAIKTGWWDDVAEPKAQLEKHQKVANFFLFPEFFFGVFSWFLCACRLWNSTGSHGLCPYFYNAAFTHNFYATDNVYRCPSRRIANNLPSHFKMGYMETRKLWEFLSRITAVCSRQ